MEVLEQMLEQGTKDTTALLQMDSLNGASLFSVSEPSSFVAAASGPVDHPETRDVAILGYD